jgi:DNA-binding MarR family transcriptional regulator
MIDDTDIGPSPENLRTLIYFMGLIIDHKLVEHRRGTAYAKVRPSDIRVFVTAARESKTIAKIARELHITRQSVQKSVQRLVDLGVLAPEAIEGNNRDKNIVLTQRGILARGTAGNQIGLVEGEFAKIIGTEGVENLRQMLMKIVAANTIDLLKSRPSGG